MGVEFRKGSRWWYGRYIANGKRHCTNLRVKVRGEVPAEDNSWLGDETFRMSRVVAESKLSALAEEAQSPAGSARLIEKIYELKTGIAIKRIPVADLAKEWEALPRRRPPSAEHLSNSRSVFTRFLKFLAASHPEAKDLSRITPAIAKAFLDEDAKRGISSKTWNDHLILLRSAFKGLLPVGSINPLAGIPTREVETVYRQPFSPEELNEILTAAKDDPEFRPVIITGMCTAMRRGDCCTLKWKDVDFTNRFLNVKTAKTGQTVAIPIFPLLLSELEARKGNGSEYVFPDIAAKYLQTPLNITRRIRRVLAAAGFADVNPDEIPRKGKPGPKTKPKIQGVFRGAVTVAREKGKGRNRISIRDFHSFRVTWVTLALTAGVPLELVQRVTGHKTTDIVLKHYFQPGRDAFRNALQNVMPRLLAQPQGKTLREEQMEAVNKLKGKIPKKVSESLLALAARITT